MNNYLKLIISVVVSELAGVFGLIFTTPAVNPSTGSGQAWYATLVKPELAPPNWIFAPVWTILFFILGVSLYVVWKNDFRVVNPVFTKKAWNKLSERLWTGDLQKLNTIAIFSVQYILNILWSFVFFGLHSPGLAFFVLLALWFSIIYLIINFYRISKIAGYLLIPYILWVSFAGYLNYSIWQLNTNTEEFSGIRGVVFLGPICPVMKNPPEPKCADKPYKTSLVATTPDGGRVIKQFNSDATGNFRVDLAAGEYAIRSAATANILPRCGSSGAIKVVSSKYTDTIVNCDTGIR